jgi:hypothetical protein
MDCRRSKRNSASAAEFEYALEKNLRVLLEELQAKKYEPGRSICFVVREPKPREVFAACFRDRIVHHLLVNELMAMAEKIFIHDSYACRIEKGTHRAVKRLRDFLRRSGVGHRPLWFLQLDIDGFFMSIDKNILYALAAKLIARHRKSAEWAEDISWLTQKIIWHDPTKDFEMNSPAEYFNLIPDRKSLFKQPPGRGLAIGNYSSQFFANLYLNELDQFAKRNLKCRMYLRYVDDFIMLNHDPEVLREWMKRIKYFTREKLNLKISERKIRMQETGKGIDFLGYFVKPDYALARRSVVARFKRKLSEAARNKIPKDDIGYRAMISSYFGHFSHGDCEQLVRKFSISET